MKTDLSKDTPAAFTGPLDEAAWPEKLTARVVTPGPRPRLHGYDVEGDLARHYSFVDAALLALTGSLPTPERSRAFDVALQFAAPVSAREAPVHAAILARICAATTSQMQGVSAIGLGEQARTVLATHRAWLDALSEPYPTVPKVPEQLRPVDEGERESVERLRRALRGTLAVPALAQDLGRDAALLAVLHACGLRTAETIECALVLARLPVAMAEALSTPAGSYRQYPVQLPPIAYTQEPS